MEKAALNITGKCEKISCDKHIALPDAGDFQDISHLWKSGSRFKGFLLPVVKLADAFSALQMAGPQRKVPKGVGCSMCFC